MTQLTERFWRHVDPQDTASCWEWQGPCSSHGYGVLNAEARRRYAHRLAWELLMGPIPDGLTIDHLCFNKRCVNPNHLEPVTAIENVNRARDRQAASQRVKWAVRDRCKRGHRLTTSNTRITPIGTKRCKECRREDQRAYLARLQA